MPKLVKVAPHLEVEELERRYRNSSEGIERTHWQILWLIAKGKSPNETAEFTGYTARWIRKLVARYNEHGESAVGDLRHQNEGSIEPLLSPEELDELRIALNSSPPDGGLWNGPKVANWISKKLGRSIRRQRGWDYLKKIGDELEATPPKAC